MSRTGCQGIRPNAARHFGPSSHVGYVCMDSVGLERGISDEPNQHDAWAGRDRLRPADELRTGRTAPPARAGCGGSLLRGQPHGALQLLSVRSALSPLGCPAVSHDGLPGPPGSPGEVWRPLAFGKVWD